MPCPALRALLFVVPTLALALPVAAGGIADIPGTAPVSIKLDFSAYDCAAIPASSGRRHIGQVIDGRYREWNENATGAAIHCLTQLKPTLRQMTRAEAEQLMADSAQVGKLAAPAPMAAGVEKAQSAASGDPSATTLPRSVDGPGARETADGAAPSTLQPLLGSVTGNTENKILDLGFPAPASGTRETAAAARREAPLAIGTDDRTRVVSSGGLPWNTIGQLIVTWKDGTQTACTGTLVSPYVVLTAGQCAHNRDKGGFAAGASFAPGQIQSGNLASVEQPYGARNADFVETNGRWTQISGGQTIQTPDARSDYAAYYFVAPWTISTFMPVVYADTNDGVVNTAGYPVDAGNSKSFNQGTWTSSGVETARSKNILRAFQVREFSADVSAGQNGAPFWTLTPTSARSIVGVVSYGGDEVAGGVWFGGENYTAVSNFVAWQPTTSSPTHQLDDLRVPVVYPSSTTFAQSFLRFYNPTPATGTVTVTVADGNTGTTLGTWTSPSLAPFSSLQFNIREIEQQATPAIAVGGRDRYTLNIASNFLGYFQHVLWNVQGASLTNLSGCSNGISSDVIHMGNVNTTQVGDFPSVIIVHNVGARSTNAVVGVYNAKTGERIGGVVIPNVPPNADAAFGMSDVETALNHHPAADEYNYNLVVESDFPGYLQHLVYNTRAGLITNMTAKCNMPIH